MTQIWQKLDTYVIPKIQIFQISFQSTLRSNQIQSDPVCSPEIENKLYTETERLKYQMYYNKGGT